MVRRGGHLADACPRCALECEIASPSRAEALNMLMPGAEPQKRRSLILLLLFHCGLRLVPTNIWAAAGCVDTEIGCFRKPEVADAETEVQSRVQGRGGSARS